MPNMDILISIPEGKVTEYATAYLKVHPNNEVDDRGAPIYTSAQWMKEDIRRYIVNQIKRGKGLIYRSAEPPPVVDNIT